MTYAVRCRPLHAGPLPMTHNDSQRRGVEGGGAGFLILRRVETFPKEQRLRKTLQRCNARRRPSISERLWEEKKKKKLKANRKRLG